MGRRGLSWATKWEAGPLYFFFQPSHWARDRGDRDGLDPSRGEIRGRRQPPPGLLIETGGRHPNKGWPRGGRWVELGRNAEGHGIVLSILGNAGRPGERPQNKPGALFPGAIGAWARGSILQGGWVFWPWLSGWGWKSLPFMR